MDSAKKSVEKILEIAKKHGYDCVVALKKGDDAYAGMNEIRPWVTGIQPTFGKAFYEAANTVQGTPLATDSSNEDYIKIQWGVKDGE